MKKPRPPCVQNIERFRETGCPERPWDGFGEGCSAWHEESMPMKDDTSKTDEVKGCAFTTWMFKFHWSMCGLLEGNQAAINSLRDCLVLADPTDPFSDIKARPKDSPGMAKLIQRLEKADEHRELLIDFKVKETLVALGIDRLQKPSGEVILLSEVENVKDIPKLLEKTGTGEGD
jgi:hypothetical protein